MGEQHASPGGFIRLFLIGQSVTGCGKCVPKLCVKQSGLAVPVRHLYPALGGVAAGEDNVELMLHQRKLLPHSFRLPEKFAYGAETKLRKDGPFHHFLCPLQIPPGGPAAVVAHAVYNQPGFQPAGTAGNIQKPQCWKRCYAAVIPILLPVNQHFFSGRRTPTVQGVVPIQAAAMIIIFDTAQRVQFRQIGAVAKSVR